MTKTQKSIITAISLLSVLLLAACGGDKSNEASASTNSPQKLTYEKLEAEYGEQALQALYVDVMAHSTLDFLKNAIEEDVDLMSMTAEERNEYARKRGAEIGKQMAKKIAYAVEKNGYTMAEWGRIVPHANENDWYNKLDEQISARKAELKAKLEAEGSLD